MNNLRLSGWSAVIAYTTTVLVILFVLAPLAVAVALSFSGSPFMSFPPRDLTFDWYIQLLDDGEFLRSLWFSVLLALAATCLSLALGLPAAFALSRTRFPGKGLVQSFLLSPLIFPVLISGLALLKMFSAAGMTHAGWNLLLAHSVIILPYVIRTVTASLQLVDLSLEDAARTLGANRWVTFYRITAPQIAPGVAAGALFAFMVSLDNFPISMWLSTTQYNPLPMLLYQRITRLFDPSIAAMSTLMILVGILAVIIIERLVGVRKAMGV